MATTDFTLERGLPASVEAERSILGAILLDTFSYTEAASALRADHFSLDSHRRIYARMIELGESARAIDLISLAEELGRNKELEAVGGVAYLSSLTDGVPRRPSIEQHIRLVKDKAVLRSLIHACNSAVTRALEHSDTAAEILDATEAELFRLTEDRATSGLVSIPEIVRDQLGGSLDKLYEKGQRITGLATHFDDLDTMTSGLQPADLVIIAARPSMGKTAFAMNIAENAAVIDARKVAVFSLEMSARSLLMRLLSSHARVDAHRLRTGFISREDAGKLTRAMATLVEAPIFIDDTAAISVQEVRAKARRMKQKHGLDLIVVDYLQLMAPTPIGTGKRYENRTQEVSAISRGLKSVAKELNVPVIALSQLSRAPESRGERGHRPQLADLRESGSIEQDADVVGFIFREEVYRPDEPELDGLAELIIAKQRNGPVGTVPLAFLKSLTRFESRATDVPLSE